MLQSSEAALSHPARAPAARKKEEKLAVEVCADLSFLWPMNMLQCRFRGLRAISANNGPVVLAWTT